MTTSNKSAAFGKLLKGAINGIANYEGKTAPVIEEEVGELIGVSGKTIQRYKTGYLPPFDRDNDAVRVLAEAAVRRGFLGREWLERFLHAARYPAAEKLLNELCPVSAPPHAKPDRVYQNLPAPTYSHFVMRQQAFAEVVDGIERRSAVVLIASLGGMGKTSLAREIAAHSLQEDSAVPHFDAVVWVSDRDRPGTTTFSLVLDIIAQTLDYPGIVQYIHSEKQYEVEQLLRRQRVLLVVDNFETITDGLLLEWLLRLPEPSKAIITTRQYRREFRNSAILVNLHGMTERETWELVDERLRVLRMETLVSDPTQLEPLLTATGGNPKAITLTMGLLKYERRPLQQIVDDLYAARGDLFDDLFSRAWALLDEAARRLLMITTFFVDSAGSEALSATADVTGFDFDRAMERLTDLSLLDVQQADLASEPRYTLHPLVRAFAGARLAEQPAFEEEARKRWLEWYVELTAQVGWCWDDVTRLSLLDPEHETAYHVLEWSFEYHYYTISLQIARGIRYYYVMHGFLDRGLLVYIKGADAASKLGNIGQEVVLLAVGIQILGRQGDFALIESYLPRLHHLACSDSVTEDVIALFEYHCAVAWYWMARDDFQKAEQAFRKGTAMAQKTLPVYHCLGAQWLGLSLYKQEKRREARNFFQEAVWYGEHGGAEFCLAQAQLANLELDVGNLDIAEKWLLDAMEVGGGIHDREVLCIIYRIYARLYTLRNDLPAAHASLMEAIDLFQRAGMRGELAEAREELARLEAQMAAAAE
jgi:tetratricopeptide (TPR) repeat protein